MGRMGLHYFSFIVSSQPQHRQTTTTKIYATSAQVLLFLNAFTCYRLINQRETKRQREEEEDEATINSFLILEFPINSIICYYCHALFCHNHNQPLYAFSPILHLECKMFNQLLVPESPLFTVHKNKKETHSYKNRSK